MKPTNTDLHGNVPDSAPVALLIIDMINDLEFPEGADVLEPALAAARNIAGLKQQAGRLNIPVVYINDNFGRWRSDFTDVVDHCLRDGVRGQPLAELLRPGPDDYFVLKPKHSAFYATTLDTLLTYLRVERLILTGLSTDICVLFSANDAYMREFSLSVPSDCVAAASAEFSQAALDFMARVLSADVTPSTELRLESLYQPLPEAAPKK